VATVNVYIGNYAIKVGYPTVIVTSRVDGGVGIGEAFVVLQLPPQMQFGLPIKQRITFANVAACAKLVSLGSDSPVDPEEYMLTTTFNWVKSQWEHLKFLEWEKNHEDLLITKNTEFTRQTSWQQELARLWFAGFPRDIFQQILEGTRVKEFAQFMQTLREYCRPQDEPIS
jgi:hypothetical protein